LENQEKSKFNERKTKNPKNSFDENQVASTEVLSEKKEANHKSNTTLLVKICGGRAFLSYKDLLDDTKSSLQLCLRFKNQRFHSNFVPSTVEPAWEHLWNMELPVILIVTYNLNGY